MIFEDMFAQAKRELVPHVGHKIEVAYYGTEKFPIDIAIECTDCNEVLIDFTLTEAQKQGREQ